MDDRVGTQGWLQDLQELVHDAVRLLRGFWINELLPLLTSVGAVLVMAAPIVLVILLLWYLASQGWHAGPGFYTIGK